MLVRLPLLVAGAVFLGPLDSGPLRLDSRSNACNPRIVGTYGTMTKRCVRTGSGLIRHSLVVWVLALLVPWLPASELHVRAASSDYPTCCKVEGGTIGVDYLYRSLPTPRGTQIIPGIVIVEVGLYPSSEQSLQLPEGAFSLDWKGAEWPLGPAGPDFVLAQLRHPEWAYPAHGGGLAGEAGTVNRRGGGFEGVVIGKSPRRQPRFPGDPRQEHPSPAPNPMPDAPRGEPHPDEMLERIIPLHALERHEVGQPTAGYIYFPYRGRLKKLRKLTLKIQLPDQNCEFLLRK